MRTLRGFARYALLLLALPLGACSAATSGGANQSRFEREVGVGTESDIRQKVTAVLLRYQFEVFQQTEPPNLQWVTRWRPRAPYADEQEQGVSNAEMRVVVSARPRGAASSLGQLYTVDLMVENRLQRLGSEDWIQTIVTPTAEAYAKEIAEEFRRQLDVGIRRYGDPCCQ